MPCLKRNFPLDVFYSTYGFEILRTTRTSSSKLIFSNDSKKLITTICKQGGRIRTFSNTLAKIFVRYFQTKQNFIKLTK